MDSAASSPPGLSGAEAAARLASNGFNDLPAAQGHSPLAIVVEVVREPMFALLLGAGVLYALIGDLAEALVLLGFAMVTVSIAIVQRGRSERVLEALRDLTSPRALVVRDGIRIRVPGREVVTGDIVVIAEGDRIPADAVLISAADLHVDESLLTGESLPVRKLAADEPRTRDAQLGGDESPSLLSGSLVVRGSGVARVTATGANSEIGKIGRAVRAIEVETPRLQAETRRIVLVSAVAGLCVSLLAIVLYGVLRGDWLQALLGGIALGMSMLPEEFPLVLTVFMVMGAWRLSRSRVLTRRASAIETLGAATVLCTDKTGTLTRNVMSVVHLSAQGNSWSAGEPASGIRPSAPLGNLLETAVLASEPQAVDPMERALHELGADAGLVSPAGGLIRLYPLRRELLAVTQVWDGQGAKGCHAAAKGAPEAIARLCRMNVQETQALMATVDDLARQGVRVLGVAGGPCLRSQLPQAPNGLELRFLGLVGLADPLREAVPDAVRECRAAGIRVVMITGDYPGTARAIARQAGIEDGGSITGDELDALSDAALTARVRQATVFARITPRQKLRIVEALKANGETVAMTGDGVNDAPALKAAHIGIAMGGRGTDVAREAASLVLLDDDFGSIVRAIGLGRRIYDNLRKAMSYILAVHIPIAGVALLPILIGEPLILTPMLIAFLELVIDPACSIVLEAESAERDAMRRPPRDPRSPMISRKLVIWSVFQGVAALLIVSAIYRLFSLRGLEVAEVRTLTFVALVAANGALILASRSFDSSMRVTLRRPNAILWWSLGLTASVLALIIAWPPARRVMGFALVDLADVAMAIAVAPVLLWILHLGKSAARRPLMR